MTQDEQTGLWPRIRTRVLSGVTGAVVLAGASLAGAPATYTVGGRDIATINTRQTSLPQVAFRVEVDPLSQRPGGGDADRLTALLRGNAFREADMLAAALLKKPGADARTLALCGLAVLKAGRIGEAEAVFSKAVELAPDQPDAHLGLGRLARIRNDSTLALAHLRRAVASVDFYEEALRQLWRTAWGAGHPNELAATRTLAEERCALASVPLPSWLQNNLAQIKDLAGRRLFEMDGTFERVRVPLIADENPRVRNRRIAFTLNGKAEYPFEIDSASADFMTVSPLLAEELGLPLTGSSEATGVGTGTASVRFSVLDRVEIGGVAFRTVPVMVSDLHTFRGLKKGLIGTGFLKRFNVTIDVEAGLMELSPLDRPDVLAGRITRANVAADVPLYLFDATMIGASVGGAPEALYILDTAAATHLVDQAFFGAHLRSSLDPARIVRSGIQGAQGAQYVDRVDGIQITAGTLTFPGETVHEFPMNAINAIGGRYAAGVLGNPLLWPYRVHLDFARGRLILERRAAR